MNICPQAVIYNAMRESEDCPPIFWGDSDSCDMAMPALAFAFHLPNDVAHCLPVCSLGHQAIFRPSCQIVQVEGEVILHEWYWSVLLLLRCDARRSSLEIEPDAAHRLCEVVQIDSIEIE